MTRETKIGLLVGLAFIIVIGILLSDHINSTTDPAPAAMGQAFDNVEQSVDSPDQRDAGRMTMVQPPAPMIPQNPVPTSRQQATAASNGSSVVEISRGADPSSVQRLTRAPEQPASVQVLPPAQNQVADNSNSQLPSTGVSDPLANLVHMHQSELTLANQPPVGIPGAANANRAAAATAGTELKIKAADGDTVTRLAAKYMGGNTKAHRQAIIEANPSMTPDGHLVISGRTYVIPVAATAQQPAPAPRLVQVPPTPKVAPAKVAPPKVASIAPAANMYTVKENDSLWKIAAEELGSGARWTDIRDLNQDVLKGSAQVRVNMRLKLPPKSVAAAD